MGFFLPEINARSTVKVADKCDGSLAEPIILMNKLMPIIIIVSPIQSRKYY
jgi:hypothetical protein